MKYLDIFYEKLLFTTKEVEDLYNTESAKHNSLATYEQAGKIRRVKRGLYAVVDPVTNDIYANKFELATKIVDGGYVAYHAALEYHGLHTQVFNTLSVASKKRFSPFSFAGIDYLHTLSKFDEGVKCENYNTEIKVTDLERTLVDCMDRIDFAGGLEELIYAIEHTVHLDEKRLIRYLGMYNKKFLYQKAGYLLSNIKKSEISVEFYNKCKSKKGNKRNYLVENRAKLLRLDNVWGLISPSNLFNEEKLDD